MPFAYAPTVEQDRQAERRLHSDAFRPELLGQPPQAVRPVEPAQRDRGQVNQQELTDQLRDGDEGPRFGGGSAAVTRRPEPSRGEGDRWQLNGQAGPDGASAGAAGSEGAGEDGKGGRRQKKKKRHRERRRAARERERCDRRSGSRHSADGQPSDTDAVVSGQHILTISAAYSVITMLAGVAPRPTMCLSGWRTDWPCASP